MNPKRRKTMTAEQLKTIEAELQKRGYKKWTTALTSSEDWAWFKTFGKKQDEDGEVTYGYQIAFRVWDDSEYPGCPKEHLYGFDFWTSALGADCLTLLSRQTLKFDHSFDSFMSQLFSGQDKKCFNICTIIRKG